jgi:integrase/recombinase XerD
VGLTSRENGAAPNNRRPRRRRDRNENRGLHPGPGGWVRLHEKGGKIQDVPANHNRDQYLAAYIKGGPPSGSRGATVPHRDREIRCAHIPADELGGCSAGGQRLPASIRRSENYTFRAMGITAYLKNGGRLEIAQLIATHEFVTDDRPLRPSRG